MSRIYVASSWRNKEQPHVVSTLRADGHEVYDFRAPFNGVPGFAWSEVDPEWQGWSAGTIILTRDGEEPELMALLATDICIDLAEVRKALGGV